MSSVEEKLQIWLLQETSGLCEARMKTVPDRASLCTLTRDKNKKIWKYVTDHVKSRQSISRIKDILALRRVQNELPSISSQFRTNNIPAIKREMSKCEEKVKFLENSYSNTRTSVFNLRESIKNISEENLILNQKCAFLETAVLNFQEKNGYLNKFVCKLQLSINIAFSVEKNLCLQYSSAIKKQDTADHKFAQLSNKSTDEKIKDLVYYMSLIVEKKLFAGNQTVQALNIHKSISDVMKNAVLVDLASILKRYSKNSLHMFEKNNLMDSNSSHYLENHLHESKIFLLNLKLSHVNSCVNKKATLKKISEIPNCCEILLEKNLKNQEQIEYISLKARNEYLRESIDYLQNMFSEEQSKKTRLLLTNEKHQCQALNSIMNEFYQKLGSFHFMLNTFSLIFSDINKSVTSSNEFIGEELCHCLNPTLIKSLDFINSNDFDCKSSSDVLKQNLLSGLLYDHSFETLNLPVDVWEMLKVGMFHNRHLFCENLYLIKNESSMTFEELNFDLDSFDVINHLKITSKSLSDKNSELKKAEKILNTDSKEDCASLKILLDDWWKQRAQFIPKIDYNGKTLEMWLNILSILENF